MSPDATRAESRVRLVGADDAVAVHAVIRESFEDRPTLDPPATATDETVETVASALDVYGGLLGTVDGEPAAALLFAPVDDWMGLRRVGVLGAARGSGLATDLVRTAERYAAGEGFVGMRLVAREELPATVRFWKRLGYAEVGRDGPQIQLRKRLPVTLSLPSPADTAALGYRLAERLGAGDLVILTGDLGAGKTTLTQALGRALNVRGEVTSPTFVISRVHPGQGDGPALVHVDAYRLGEAAELDDLDLDTDLDTAVTVVEWGRGLAEALTEDRLEIELTADPATEVRTAVLRPHGRRWVDAPLPQQV